MAILVNNRTQETCAAPGTGTVTLLGAVTGYRTFSAGIGANNLTYYTIADQTGSNWEVGIGTVGSGGTTLIRTTVLDSSNGGSLTNFSSGTQLVYSDYPANAAVLQTDVGTAPNQIPLNQYLGKLAFQDVLDTVSNNPYYDTQISDVEPTLNLDFVNSKTLDSRITFARSTTATYYDGKSSAVAEQNLFTYSQQFTNAIWSPTTATIVDNAVVAPDGTTTAASITFTAQYGSIRQFTITSGVTYTVSLYCYVASGTRVFSIYDVNGNSYGTFTATTGWARYSTTFTAASTGALLPIQDRNASGFVTTYIWGAQLEQRASATAYNATTTTAITNYIPVLQTAAINAPRLDYSPTAGTPNGLLIEEARTNLLIYSAALANNTYWIQAGTVTMTASAGIAPDGSLNAALMTSGSSNSQIAQNITVPATNIAYTQTAYVKAYSGTIIRMDLRDSVNNYAYNFNLSNLTATSLSATATSTSITSVGNGWYRISITAPNATSGTIMYSYLYVTTITNAFYVWGAQLEAGAFPTSYIPTVASQVTRSADSASISTAGWYNIGQGTWFGVVVGKLTAGTPRIVGTTTSSKAPLAFSTGGNVLSGQMFDGSSVTTTNNTLPNSILKLASSWIGTSGSICLNGGAVVSGSQPNGYANVTIITIGSDGGGSAQNINSTIQKISYYPQALSNAELSEMTL